FVAVSVAAPGLLARLGPRAMITWNLLFLSALAVALWSSRISFPSDSGAYPFLEPPIESPGRIGMHLMLLLSPILYVNFGRCAGALAAAGPSLRMLGFGFALGGLWLLLLVLGQVFTTAYDYVPVLGPWFRDRFWLVQFVAGLGAVLPALLVPVRAGEGGPGWMRGAVRVPIVAAVALALGSVGAVVYTQARPGLPPSGAPVRLMTFNLQQGYSAAGSRNFDGQLEFIRQVRPDIMGLQETDTARVAGETPIWRGFSVTGWSFTRTQGRAQAPGRSGLRCYRGSRSNGRGCSTCTR
ncbi:MAG TPA: endonuclease/exonuclease/phosphatase family protein, partial [Verrucomicrobiota bacterium]|nr:endonuclease/exonuclease/phosphatase family protein [Verrucomicrobiota bacterium]